MQQLLKHHDEHLRAARAAAWQWWDEANCRAERAWAAYDEALRTAQLAEDAALAAHDAALELEAIGGN